VPRCAFRGWGLLEGGRATAYTIGVAPVERKGEKNEINCQSKRTDRLRNNKLSQEKTKIVLKTPLIWSISGRQLDWGTQNLGHYKVCCAVDKQGGTVRETHLE